MRFKDDTYKERYKLFFIGYFALIIGITFLRFPDLRNELKYFVITEQMVETKNFIILKYFTELYPDKPPIYFWILGLVRYVTRENFYPISLIIANIIPAGITAFLGFKLSKLYWNEKMAYISTAIFITLPYIFGVSLVLRMDTLMTTFIMGSIYLFFSSYLDKKEISLNKSIYFYSCIALGVLVKGGAAFIIPILTILFYLYLDNNLSYLKKMRLLLGLGIIVTILGIWFLMMLSFPEGKSYIGLILGQETLGRVVKAKTHTRPIYYYLKLLPLTTLPLAPFFIVGLYKSLRNLKNRKKWKKIDKIAFSLFVPNLVFFSLISGKLDIYLLPLYYGIVIVSLRVIERIWSGSKEKVYRILLYINCTILIICAGLLPYYNKNFTIKESIEILKENSEKVYSYRFEDGKNICNEINKNSIENIPLEDLSKMNEGELLLVKKKYRKDISDRSLEELYSNKEYTILIKK